MYKITNTITHNVFLGNEKAILKFAQEKFKDKDQEWLDDHHWDLKKIGISDEIRTFQGAVKFLNLIYFEIVDSGDVVKELNNNEMVLISVEE